MISAVLVLIGLLAQMGIDLHVAPDQPLPYVYVDDPLVLELKADRDVAADVSIEIIPEFATTAPPFSMELGTISLRANAPWWWAVENAPVERGQYEVVAHLNVNGATEDKTALFSRIDRPVPDFSLPVAVVCETVDSRSALALEGVSVRSVRMDAREPEVSERVKAAVARGLRVVLAVDKGQQTQCETLSKDLGDCVAAWEIDAGDDPDVLAAMQRGLGRGGSGQDGAARTAGHAPVTVLVEDPAMIGKLLASSEAPQVDGVTYQGAWVPLKNLLAIRTAMERSGHEGLRLVVDVAPGSQDDAPGVGSRLARQFLVDAAVGVERTEFGKDLVLDEDLGPAYVYLNALAQIWHGMMPIGSLDIPAPATALVFRAADEWLVACWTDQPAQEVALKVGDAAAVTLVDGRNNQKPPPAISGGSVNLTLTREPQFLSGKAGSLVGAAARTMASQEAVAFCESEEFRKHLPSEAIDTVKKFVGLDSVGYRRLDFLNLLKLFPRIEGLWQSGQVAASVAAPALASVARLARLLCVLEQERGEPFVEPLQNTLAVCGQFQSLYLTSSGNATVNPRADWLMGELDRLTSEAERVAGEGRAIEANAIAVMAEWRGRELEIAARGPSYRPPEVTHVLKPSADEKAANAAADPPRVKAPDPKKADPPAKTKQSSDKKDRSKARQKHGKQKRA